MPRGKKAGPSRKPGGPAVTGEHRRSTNTPAVPGQFSNRSDLRQPVRSGPSRAYGERADNERAQQAVPLPAQPPVPRASASAAPRPSAPAAPPPLPGTLGAFARPTDRPAEPITAGLPVGPGGGPSGRAAMVPGENLIDELHGIYAEYPTPELLDVILALKSEGFA